MHTLIYSFLFSVYSLCIQVPGVHTSVVKLEAGSCYGKCPVYTVEVFSDRKSVYTGIKNVEKIGTYQRTLSIKDYNTLIKAFHQSHFFDFKDKYTSKETDYPTLYLTYQEKDKTKTIVDYRGAPENLKKLEALVQKIVNTGIWVKIL
jgi:hypothetical protein